MYKSILLYILFAVSLMSCSKQSDSNDERTVEKTKIATRDKDIYNMGRRHAAYIINHYLHSDSLAYQLLDVRARETELASRVDRKAADAYIAGFTTYVREEAPELADSIF